LNIKAKKVIRLPKLSKWNTSGCGGIQLPFLEYSFKIKGEQAVSILHFNSKIKEESY